MLKAGVVGIGKMGLSHCAILRAHSDIGSLAVCDTSGFLLSGIKKYTDFSCYTDYKKMIKENKLDCLFISTPSKFHKEIILFALQNNINVFCEKPLTLSHEDSEEVSELAEARGLVTQVGYHNKFIGTFQAVKRFLDAALIGDVYHINGSAYGPVVINEEGETWRSDPKEGGGCLLDYAAHVVDLMIYMVDMPEKVSGTILKKVYSKKVEDAVYSNLFYANGMTGQLSVNWSEETYRKMTTKIEILGKRGKIVSDAQECQVYLKDQSPCGKFEKGWNSFWITDQTEPVWFNLRGEEYSAQIDCFVKRVVEKNSAGVNSFKNSLKTDKVISMLQNDGAGGKA
ncbi:Gfo/Idh/MocA family oxidoreductase [Desulfobotulus sp. H1]|uniref:Gfo/Idh/MocA family oxidoreductase n=1 Tax=Desulfobotulus pelophilus TaxID=2823377 RepID=A0ABT3NC68_9BACT|nr:Gfo/Idh/MocA family oxidoreductase [Desulfobotulus pelophilus]MCW7755065.1 Gfo/Idh/MocA family oxidoreductase [Desulfobotulus pelophilus]